MGSSSSSSSGLSKETIDKKIKNAQDNADKIDYEKIREVGSFVGGVAGAYIGTKNSNSDISKIGSIMTGREIGSRYGGDIAESIVKSSIVGHERIIISHEVMRGKEMKDFTTMDHYLFQMNDFGK